MEKLSNTNIPILGQIAAAAQASNSEEDVVEDLPRRDQFYIVKIVKIECKKMAL